jgi:hypothetical protein
MNKSENRIQQECYNWFWNNHPNYRKLLFAVPNGGARSSQEGRLLKLTGVVAGVSDLLLMINGTTYCFELKNFYGKQSKAQKEWQSIVEKNGFQYFIIRSKEVFSSIVDRLIFEEEKKQNGK